MYRFSQVWLGAESNRRHEDFQSSALPTELPSLGGGSLCGILGGGQAKASQRNCSRFNAHRPTLNRIARCTRTRARNGNRTPVARTRGGKFQYFGASRPIGWQPMPRNDQLNFRGKSTARLSIL